MKRLGGVAAAICAVTIGATPVRGQEPPGAPPPEQRRLDFLVGAWETTDTVLPVAGFTSGTAHGVIRYAWSVGRRWLVYDFQTTLPGLGAYVVHGAAAFDPRLGRYRAVVVNNLGDLLTYEGSWADDSTLVFDLTGGAPGRNARVSYVRSAAGEVRLTSERGTTSGAYEAYFVTRLHRR